MTSKWPISVKGVLAWDQSVVVLRNERNEWELPGGRLDPTDSSAEAAVRREFQEELGIEVEVGPLIDTWIYDVAGKRVFIVTYLCHASRPERLTFSDEHTDVASLTLEELATEAIPAGYVRSIERAARLEQGF